MAPTAKCWIIAALQRQGKLRNFVAVVALDEEGAREFQQSTGFRGTVLLDPSDRTAQAYASDFCPRLWRIGVDGRAEYKSSAEIKGRQIDQAIESAGRI